MNKVTVYAAINTKIRSLEKNFLKRVDYLNMLQKRSVTDIAIYLKENTYYSKLLREIHIEKISRRDLEDYLKNNMIKNMDKLIYYFQDDYKKLIHSLYMKYEIEDLKSLSRLIDNYKESERTEKPLSFLGKYSRIDPKKLFQARTNRDLIYLLENTEFYEFLIPLVNGKRENRFRFEMALDMGYFNIVQNRKLGISNEDRKILKRWEGIIADLYNIQWIYRGKKFYNLSPEELFNYTINFGDKISLKIRKNMCYTKNLGDLYKITMSSVYGFLFKKEEVSRDIYMDRRINRFIYFKIKALIRKFPMSIIQTIGYVRLLEFEIRDIISIIESIRYDIPPQEAIKFLVKVT
ncbi:MAG: V-type ATPase subunit [Candidatus Atribacteria bacterium]|nr:V-type ATPase subunit [Candidatus Atribacteria bacterium]